MSIGAEVCKKNKICVKLYFSVIRHQLTKAVNGT